MQHTEILKQNLHMYVIYSYNLDHDIDHGWVSYVNEPSSLLVYSVPFPSDTLLKFNITACSARGCLVFQCMSPFSHHIT